MKRSTIKSPLLLVFLYFSRERKKFNTSTSTTIKLVEDLIIFQGKLVVTSHNATTIPKNK